MSWQISDGRIGAHERRDRESRGVRALSPVRRLSMADHISRSSPPCRWAADEIYVLGGVQAVVAMALGTDDRAGRHVARPATPLWPSEASALRPRRHRPFAGPTETLFIADDTVDGDFARPIPQARLDFARDSLTNSEARAGYDERSETAVGDPADRRDRARHGKTARSLFVTTRLR